MPGLTYDTGVLIGAESATRRVWALHRRALERGVRPVVPAAVLAQAWRGGPQPNLSRLLSGCRIEESGEALARAAGEACGRSRTADTIDATVVVGAVARGDAVVSADRSDIRRIAGALGVALDVIGV